MYHVDYSKRAQKQICKLDRHVQALLFAWIDKNLEGTDNPRLHGKGIAPMSGAIGLGIIV